MIGVIVSCFTPNQFTQCNLNTCIILKFQHFNSTPFSPRTSSVRSIWLNNIQFLTSLSFLVLSSLQTIRKWTVNRAWIFHIIHIEHREIGRYRKLVRFWWFDILVREFLVRMIFVWLLKVTEVKGLKYCISSSGSMSIEVCL